MRERKGIGMTEGRKEGRERERKEGRKEGREREREEGRG